MPLAHSSPLGLISASIVATSFEFCLDADDKSLLAELLGWGLSYMCVVPFYFLLRIIASIVQGCIIWELDWKQRIVE